MEYELKPYGDKWVLRWVFSNAPNAPQTKDFETEQAALYYIAPMVKEHRRR
jgi:hypothetical protein